MIQVTKGDILRFIFQQPRERIVNMGECEYTDKCGCVMVHYGKEKLNIKFNSCGFYNWIDTAKYDDVAVFHQDTRIDKIIPPSLFLKADITYGQLQDTINMKQKYIINIREATIEDGLTVFTIGTFPGGERHIKLPDFGFGPDVTVPVIQQESFNSTADLFDIILINDALQRMGFKEIELRIPYFPGARQDRVCNPGEALSVAVYANIINSCGFSAVHIMTPHSEVAPALIHNVKLIDDIQPIADFVEALIEEQEITSDCKDFNIIIPDAGAAKRTHKIVDKLRNRIFDVTFHVYQCEKVRDVTNGKLSGFKIHAEDLGGYPTLVIDDIVANGGTFLGLAPVIRAVNAGTLAIHVTHADNATGLANLAEVYERVSFVETKTHLSDINGVDNKSRIMGHPVPYSV